MTSVESTTNVLTEQQLGLMIQYTVEAYKTFEKLAENLPNPVAAQMFKAFAVDEREARDLIELKIIATGSARVRVIQFRRNYGKTAGLVAAFERSARLRTCCATTAKLRPCSPARAASIAAFKASRLL